MIRFLVGNPGTCAKNPLHFPPAAAAREEEGKCSHGKLFFRFAQQKGERKGAALIYGLVMKPTLHEMGRRKGFAL